MSAKFQQAVLEVLGEEPEDVSEDAQDVCDRALLCREEYGIPEEPSPNDETFQEYVRVMQSDVLASRRV